MKEKSGIPTPSLRAIVRYSFCLAIVLFFLSQCAFALPMKKYAVDSSLLGASPSDEVLDGVNLDSPARHRTKESGFVISSEKMTYCSESGECETQVLIGNEAGDIPGLKVELDYGFSGDVDGVSAWQSLVTSSRTELVRGANGNEVKRIRNYVWAPLDTDRFTFLEKTNRSIMLKYNVTPCSNGTWSLKLYSPFGSFAAVGGYASVCSAKGGLSKFDVVLERGDSWEIGKNPDGTTSQILYAANVNHWNGKTYEPINKTVEKIGPDEESWTNDYRFKIEGSYSAHLKSEMNAEWPVLVSSGAVMTRTRPVGIAYLEGGRYRFIQLASNSSGIPNGNSVTYRGVFTGADFAYYYEESQLKEKITLGNEFRALLTGLKLPPETELYFVSEVDYGGLVPTSFGARLEFGNQANTSIDFTDNFGNIAYSFAPATVKDSSKALVDGKEVPYPDSRGMPAVLTENAGKRYYAVSVPLYWLTRSTYPVEIDPTVQFQQGDCLNYANGYNNTNTLNVSFQTRWNITALHSSASIAEVRFCAYCYATTGGTFDTDATYWRVNNQTWTNSITATHYTNLPLTDQNTTQTWNTNLTNAWHCINISQPFFTDFNAKNENFSIRFEDPDWATSLPVTNTITGYMAHGSLAGSPVDQQFRQCGYASTNETPYLNVTLNSNTCQNISSSLKLYNSVTSTGTCFNFTTENVSLDCNGYTVSGNLSNNAFGVLANNLKNVTVKNCLISNYTNAINYTGTNNSYIINTTIYNTTGSGGIGGTNGASCTVGTNGGTVYGITLSNAKNTTVENSTLSNLTAGVGGTGGNGSGSDKNGCNGGVGGSVYGIQLSSNSLNTTFKNDTLTRLAGGKGGNGGNATATGLQGSVGGNGSAAGASYAIYASDAGSANNTMLSVNISLISGGTGGTGGRTNAMSTTANGGYGGVAVGVYALSETNVFTGAIYNVTGGTGGAAGDCSDSGGATGGNGGDSFGLNVSATNANTTVENATLENFTAGTGGDAGCNSYGTGGTSYIFSAINSRYGTIKNSTLTNSTKGGGGGGFGTPGSGYGIYFSGASTTDYNVINSSISQISTSDVYSTSSPQNNTFLNVTLNKNKISFGTCTTPCNLTLQWYLRVNVTTGGSALQNAIVNISDVLANQKIITNRTGSDGMTNYTILTEMIMNKTSTVLNNYTFNNHAINVSASGYAQSATTLNVTVSMTYNVSLTAYSTCGNINTNTVLNQNVSSPSTCFNITANDTTLDCNGYWINYSTAGRNGAYGVNNTGQRNVTIKNCIIYTGSTSASNSHAIYITNNANNNTITNNTIHAFGSGSYGIYLLTLISNASVNSNVINTYGATGYGILLGSTTGKNNSIYLNTINTNGSGAQGIRQTVTSNHAIFLNNISTNGSTGHGIALFRTACHSVFYSNNITTVASDAYGIYVQRDIYNDTFWNNTITTAGTSVYFDAQIQNVYNNLFANSTITNASAVNIYSIGTGGLGAAYNDTFLNVSFNKDMVGWGGDSTDNITVQWYARVNVTDSSGAALQNAVVNISDSSPAVILNQNLTGSDGLTNFTIVTEMHMNSTQNRTFNNHSINATYSIAFNSTSINITGTTTINLTMYYSSCRTITQNTILYNNLYTTGSCIVFGANSIYLDCNGYSINGDGGSGDIGINTNMTNGTTTKNCVVSDFQRDIQLYLSYNSTVNNNTLKGMGNGTGTHWKAGIYFAGFNGTNITNNIIYNLTTVQSSSSSFAGDVYGIWGTSNCSNNTIRWNRIENITGGYGRNSSSLTQAINGANASGMYFAGNNTIMDNNVTNVTGGHGGTGLPAVGGTGGQGGTGGTSYGIWVNSQNNWVLRNNVSNITGGVGGTGGTSDLTGGMGGTGGTAYGMNIDGGSNKLVLNNVTNITGGQGGDGGAGSTTGGAGGIGGNSYLEVVQDSSNTIDNDTLTYATGGQGGSGGAGTTSGAKGNGGYSYVLRLGLGAGSNNVITYVTLKNATGGAVGASGTGTGSAGWGYGAYLASEYDSFTNVSISEATYDLYLSQVINTVFLNCSFDKTRIVWESDIFFEQNLTRKWYIRVNTTDNTGSPLTATVNASDIQKTYVINGETAGASGLTNIVPTGDVVIYWPAMGVAQYERTFNNHTVNASYGLGFNTTSINITGNFIINITLYGTTADLSFTITLPSTGCTNGKGCVTGGCSTCTRAWIETTDLTGAANQACVMPEGQTSGTAFLNFTNTGNVNLNWTMKLNSGFASTYKLNFSNGTNNCGGSSQVTTSFSTVQANIGSGSSAYAWLYGEFINALYGSESENLNHTSQQS